MTGISEINFSFQLKTVLNLSELDFISNHFIVPFIHQVTLLGMPAANYFPVTLTNLFCSVGFRKRYFKIIFINNMF